MRNLKETLKRVMTLAWQFVRNNGYTMSEALKVSWLNIKLHSAMVAKTVKFVFRKKDGSSRIAFGTLRDVEVKGTGIATKSTSAQAYFDTEKNAWRSYVKANLISIE